MNSTTVCGTVLGLTNPIFAYVHTATRDGAITGGAFVPNGAWSPASNGQYLYNDFLDGDTVIGVTGQFSAVDDLLTGEENLLLMGHLLHLPAAERRARAARLLERFDLVEAARRTPATYSGGMRRAPRRRPGQALSRNP